MAEFASNVPISRPAVLPPDATADWNFNGIMWSNKYGFIFGTSDELMPIQPPKGIIP